jgi:hypothetical protein
MARVLVGVLGFVVLGTAVGCQSRLLPPTASEGPSRDRPLHRDEYGSREIHFPAQPLPKKTK